MVATGGLHGGYCADAAVDGLRALGIVPDVLAQARCEIVAFGAGDGADVPGGGRGADSAVGERGWARPIGWSRSSAKAGCVCEPYAFAVGGRA